jgi:transposase
MEKRGTKQEREARRFRALALLREGRGVCDVAEILGVTAGAVSQWKTAFDEQGEAGLRSKPHPGGQFKLAPERLAKLPEILLAGPERHGFSTKLWTLTRVAEVIDRKFGVLYHPAHVWKILVGLGWSCQKPERRARERDENAIAEWRDQKWPRIKRGPRGQAGPSSS